MKNLFKYTLGVLFAGLTMTACSPEEFEGADPNGIPTVNGIDYQIAVDQETNQMVASYTPAAGTYPIWILNGTQYSTLQEVGYNNPEAGTYTVELRLGNRNGISQTGIKKEFTFNETKVDYSADFRRICNKEWRFANQEVAHLACGPAGTAGTEWWSAAPNEKKAFGLYDDRITFTNDNRKGGTFTYNAGEDGLTYVNYGATKLNPDGKTEDFDKVMGNQTSTWSFEQLKWEDADGQVTTQQYIKLAANTTFPYISSNEQYENPLFRIESLTATKLVLIYETPNRSIAWRFIFTSAPNERLVEESGFDPNSDCNMFKTAKNNITFWYADENWSQRPDPTLVEGNNSWTINLPLANTQQWQSQMAFRTDMATNDVTNYDFSIILNSDKDLAGATVKLTQDDNDEIYFFADRVDLKAGQDYVFFKSDMPGVNINNVKLVLDFGGCQDNTTIDISNFVLKEHGCDDGTIVPGGGGGAEGVTWVDVNSADNLGRDFNTIGTMEFWWADGGWQQIGNPKFSYNNGVYTIIANDATAAEWQAQNSIHHAQLNIEPGQLYDVRAKIESSEDLGRFTFKICDEGDDDNTLIYDGNLTLQAGENYIEFIGVKAQKKGEDSGFGEAKLFVDLGGCPAGLQIDLSEIIVQKHQEGGSGGGDALDYNDAGNLWKAVDDGSMFNAFGTWFANDGWAELEKQPAITHNGDTYELTIPDGMGTSQWQGQFHIDTKLTASAAKQYDFQLFMEVSDDCPQVTFKLTDDGDSNYFFEERQDVSADDTYVFTRRGLTLKEGKDAAAIRMFFDFGGSPIGTKVKISKIVFKEAQ